MITWILCVATVLFGFGLTMPLIISGYEDWIGVLRDPGASAPTRQFTLYSVLARDAIALAISATATIVAWEQLKRVRPQPGWLLLALILLVTPVVIYQATH